MESPVPEGKQEQDPTKETTLYRRRSHLGGKTRWLPRPTKRRTTRDDHSVERVEAARGSDGGLEPGGSDMILVGNRKVV